MARILVALLPLVILASGALAAQISSVSDKDGVWQRSEEKSGVVVRVLVAPSASFLSKLAEKRTENEASKTCQLIKTQALAEGVTVQVNVGALTSPTTTQMASLGPDYSVVCP